MRKLCKATTHASFARFHAVKSYEMTDLALMSGLQKNVYPRYDELKALRGLEGVKTHLSYVREKQAPYSKGNMAKYLKKRLNNTCQL
ncbi:hypothetical protein EsVE80_p2-00020 (plasmid) [Enterococcus saigonensis]|uniref:Lactococcus lactis RepB C-terminal domain-containing protein n=1 Tax=Enterococcus saigonensis TaxID=1805431 RepID=A0A679IBU9_9ENTE|nr:hypothetical protein [Enterococcus saigonensis]BCA87158.1 hypothetical protein EsVE80_p2-00020 [Enterococcus saigonensis]